MRDDFKMFSNTGNNTCIFKLNNMQVLELKYLVSVETYDREIFADVSRKKRQGKKGKGVRIEKKRRKIVKGKVENWNWK